MVAPAVLHRRTRRHGAAAAALLFVAVPANVQLALDADTGLERALTYARLPLQVPLVLRALAVRRPAAR